MNVKMIIVIFIFFVVSLQAQDRHFWDQAVGGRTALLGGIAIAGVRDYSATFYNPGALGFLPKKSLNFNFNAYGIKDWQFINGGGPGIDSRYTRVSLYPASLAGSLPSLGDSLNRYSFMIYSTGYSYVRISERYEGYQDVIPTRPPSFPGSGNLFEGDEYLINQGKIDVLLSEVSVGFGYSRKIADNVGIGFSIIGAYRDQTKIRYETYAAFDTTQRRTASSDVYVDIDYWAVRFSLKFGISAEWDKLKFGATITTPSLAIKKASGGTAHASIASTNVLVIVDSTNNSARQIDFIASDRQEGLPVRYKSPLSISAGVEYEIFKKTLVNLAVEWFTPLATYVVMQPESGVFIANDPITGGGYDSAEILRVYDSMKNVINAGIAVEQNFGDKFNGYAAFRTNISNANFSDINGLFVGFTDINIYHFSLGASVNLNDRFIGIGFEYGHGQRSDFPQIFNFPTAPVEPGDIAILSDRGTSKAIYNNFNIFFGVMASLRL
jgi:hypothetical protein